MKKNQRIYILFLILFISVFGFKLSAQTPPPGAPKVPLGIPKDTVDVISKVDSLIYPFQSNEEGSLYLTNPSKEEIYYDADLQKFVILEKIGDSEIKRPLYLTQEEYKEYRLKKDMLEYFQEKTNATNSKRKGSEEAQKDLLPTYYVNSSFFESVFGGNTIEVNPSGSVLINMGVLYQNVDNPQLSEDNRSSFTFDFDQEISASIQAKVGTRLKVNAQYDTESTFDFQNQIKLEYTPTEDDILQKVEVGDVSMPIKNSLITGAQNLFGVKAQLKFGKTTVTGVFAEQSSETTTVSAEGGSTVQEFELQASDYDQNRHFFLSQYFRDNYNSALENFPLINSAITITNIEVWKTNTSSATEDVRNIVALADLGESDSDNIGPANVTPNIAVIYPTNEANDLSDILTLTNDVRSISTVGDGLYSYSMQQGRDYSVLENAVKLSSNDYSYDSQLGYLTLNSKLSDSEILAVAFQYTVSGSSEVYTVGEFTSDGIPSTSNLVVKLLRSEIISTDIPMWDLMMKNVYSLSSYQIEEDGFRLEVQYEDDETGVSISTLQNAVTSGVSDITLLNLLDVDRLDSSEFEVDDGDGYFDFIDGVTIDADNGYIFFPNVEPFGADLEEKVSDPSDETYIFSELYEMTQSEAKNNYQNKDKYLITGYHTSESSSGISLGTYNVSQGSVVVTSGGRQLVEGVDYVVDYQMGTVEIVNPSLEASNASIDVSVENNSTYNLQTKRFMGIDVEHQFSENFLVGATFLNLNETSTTDKVTYGNEAINNSIFGLNTTYSAEAPVLTKLVNKLPNIETDVVSNFSIRGDFAYLKPGSSSSINQDGEATSYIDDFEGSEIPLEMSSSTQWTLASTPQYQTDYDFNGEVSDISYGYERARLAWYIIDPLFYGSSSTKPDNIDNAETSRAEVRKVKYEELFPEQDLDLTESTIVRTFDLAYYPHERGSYNYQTTNVDADGYFTNPEDKWGGITRALTTTNFEESNVEYIEFWLMDPYEHYSITSEEGLPDGIDPDNVANQVGDLYFNLGNISEDVLKDGRKLYENGLPEDELDISYDETIWGRVPSTSSLIYAFGDSDSERLNQDVGLDGLTDDEELSLFGSDFGDDPSNDNYSYYRSTAYDNADAGILTRYKKYNNTQGNSPTTDMSTESYPTSATSTPDVEDINEDQTMSSVESYYQYRVSLNQSDLVVGENHIVDEKNVTVELADGTEQDVRWLQFRVQISAPDENINDISGYSSIRFMRMFLTNFKMPVVLRFGEFQLVRGDWRRYTNTLNDDIDPEEDLTTEELQNFEVGVVSIEENDDRTPIPYVLPPGIEREVLRGSTTIQEQDEQSITLKVTDLEADATRAVYKNVSMDLRMYNKLKLFVHAEGIQTETQVEDGELKAIIRLGSDLDDNYYQIEKPLYISSYSASEDTDVWPTYNNIESTLEDFGLLKLERLNAGASSTELYPVPEEGEEETYIVRVKGNPSLASVKTIMLGVKNVSRNNQSAEVWFNELRLADFDNEGGWAAVVSADANFADFADVSVTGSIETSGFGSIEESVNERSQEDTKQYDLVANVNLGQLLPKKWGLQLPLNYSIAESVSDPKYDSQYDDVLYEEAEEYNSNSVYSREYTKRKSISLMNVRKQSNPEENKKQKFYSLENLSASYAYNESSEKSYTVEKDIDKDVRATVTYNYSFEPKTIEPFKNITIFDKKYLKFLKDFNLSILPTTLAVNSTIYRTYSEQLSRTLIDGLSELPTLTQRNFMFDWDYTIGYNLTKSLQFNFNASNSYVYDTFEDDSEVDIFDNFFTVGRPDNYNQALNLTYKLPLEKLPYLDFLKANYAYTADFDWQASSQSYVDLIGNVVQNANTHNWNVDVDFEKFYDNLGLEKLFVKKSKSSKNKKGKDDKNVTTNDKAKPSLRQRASSISKLSKPKTIGGKIGKGVYDVLTSIKKAKINYTENNGTYLPGYVPEIGFLGRDSYDGSLAPTLGFVFGSQVDIRQKAIENGWLINRNDTDTYYSKTYSRTHLNKLNLTFTVEPVKNLDIQLTGNKTYTKSLTQQLDVVNGALSTDAVTSEYGNFSISYNMLGASFKNLDQLFEDFKDNRDVIAERLASKNSIPVSGYGDTQQEVMLSSFLAAYTGADANKINLDAFRNIPIPGWQLTYKGFMKMKWFKKRFRSFSVSHSYNSMYSIASFSNNLEYDATDITEVDISDNYYSPTLYTTVNLIEEFSPLVKLDVKMKNSFSFSGRINTDKSLTLNFSNNTITQNSGVEYTVGMGYRIKDLAMSFNFGGEKTRVKGDLDLKADLSLREDKTIIRAVDEDDDQVTGGQRLLALKFYADYSLTKNITTSFYFEQSSSQYAISTTYPRQSVSTGLSIRYILGN